MTLIEQAAAPAATDTKPADGAQTQPASAPSTANGGGDSATVSDPAKAGDQTVAKPTDAAPQGAPEQYDFKQPEQGYKVDAETLSAFSGVAKELNLTQEAASKVLEVFRQKSEARAVADGDALVTGWEQATKADAEIGGVKLERSVALARKALEVYGTPALRQLLGPIASGGSGLGSHAEVIRLLSKVGALVKEDAVVPASAASAPAVDSQDYATRVYGKKT